MTSSRQTLPTTVVYDYLMKAGDATATTPSPLTGAEVRITLQYDRATTPSPLTYVAPMTIPVTTDSNGYWTANLVPNSGTSGLSPSNTLYTVQTPYSVYQISVPTTGGPYQSSSIIANGLSALAPATTSLTGPLTVAGELTATDFKATGLTGAVQPSRYVGATTFGAPTGGTFLVGDFVISQLSGSTLVCTVAGSPGTWVTLAGVFNVKDYGAKGDFSNDDTTPIQNAINAATTNGGVVFLPPGRYKTTAALIVKANVQILGANGYTNTRTPSPTTQINGTGAYAVLDDAGGQLFGVTIEQLSITGPGATSGSKGIHATNAWGWTLRDLFFDQFGDNAVIIDAGTGGRFANIYAQNCMLIRSGRAAMVGVIDINVTDAVWNDVEASASIATTDNDGNIYGIVNRGTNSSMTNCIGHLAQRGIGIPAGSAFIRAVGCRADLCNGNGFQIDGAANELIGCLAYRNSQTTDNTSSGFVLTAGQNHVMGCQVDGLSGDAKQQKNGFDDTAGDPGNNVLGNQYVGNRIGATVRGSLYNITNYRQGTAGLVGQDWVVGAGLPGGGALQLSSPHKISVTTGVPGLPNGLNPTAGDLNFRKDALTLEQALAICTTGGGSPVWKQLRTVFALTDAATVAVDASLGTYYTLAATTSRTIGAPTNAVSGLTRTFEITNSSGGVMTTTWNGAFKLAGAWVDPANTKIRKITFTYNGTNWVEDNRTAADI